MFFCTAQNEEPGLDQGYQWSGGRVPVGVWGGLLYRQGQCSDMIHKSTVEAISSLMGRGFFFKQSVNYINCFFSFLHLTYATFTIRLWLLVDEKSICNDHFLFLNGIKWRPITNWMALFFHCTVYTCKDENNHRYFYDMHLIPL